MTDPIIEKYISSQMQDAGYDTSKLAQNIFMLILTSSLTVLVLIMTLPLAACTYKVAPRAYDKIKLIWRYIFWNALLRTSLETKIVCL